MVVVVVAAAGVVVGGTMTSTLFGPLFFARFHRRRHRSAVSRGLQPAAQHSVLIGGISTIGGLVSKLGLQVKELSAEIQLLWTRAQKCDNF